MDVFRVRDRLIEGYREFTGSFIEPPGRGWKGAGEWA